MNDEHENNPENEIDDDDNLGELSQEFVEEQSASQDEDALMDEDYDSVADEASEDDFDDSFEFDLDGSLGGDLDIDAALASLGGLEAELAEREEQELLERERIEDERREREEEAERRATHYFPRPPLISLKRGQMASVIPALLLMVIGAWLTLANESLQVGIVTVVVVASVGLMLFVQWLTSDRWSRGTGFLGLALMLCSGVVIFLANNDSLNTQGYPLVIVSIGVAILLTQFLSQPIGINLTFIGVVFVLSGIIGLAVSTDLIGGAEWVDLAEVVWLPLTIVIAVLLLVPVVLRRGRE